MLHHKEKDNPIDFMIISRMKYENGKVATRVRCPDPNREALCPLYCDLSKPPHSSTHLNHPPQTSARQLGISLPDVKTKKPLQRLDGSERLGKLVDGIDNARRQRFYLKLKLRHCPKKLSCFLLKVNIL